MQGRIQDRAIIVVGAVPVLAQPRSNASAPKVREFAWPT